MVLKGILHDVRKGLTQGQAFFKVIGIVNLDYLFLQCFNHYCFFNLLVVFKDAQGFIYRNVSIQIFDFKRGLKGMCILGHSSFNIFIVPKVWFLLVKDFL